jgi:hypothetical protein
MKNGASLGPVPEKQLARTQVVVAGSALGLSLFLGG